MTCCLALLLLARQDHPARHYVALRQSYEVALQGNAPDRAETALRALQERFAAPVAPLKLAVLALRAKGGSEFKAYANHHLQLAAEADDEEDFDVALKAAKGAADFPLVSRHSSLVLTLRPPALLDEAQGSRGRDRTPCTRASSAASGRSRRRRRS